MYTFLGVLILKKSQFIFCVYLLSFIITSSTCLKAAELFPQKTSSSYCPPRYLVGEDLAISEAFTSLGAEPFDPNGFSKLEQEASAEIKNWNLPSAPNAILVFLDELNDRGMSKQRSPICGYDAKAFKSLLWLATKIIWQKQAHSPITPHTFQAMADTSLSNIWQEGFAKGLYGLPIDKKIAECWQKNSITSGQICIKMAPNVVADLERSINELEFQ
jgi:hypothetical protein